MNECGARRGDILKYHGVSPSKIPSSEFWEIFGFPAILVFTVHRTCIRTREFAIKRKFVRNVGTHFRCIRWTKFRPRCGPIKRYSYLTLEGTYYLPRDFWPSSVNQKTISDFWDLNPGPNSLLAIVASLHHLPATSVKSHKYYKFQPSCRRAVLVAASLWPQLTQRCRL